VCHRNVVSVVSMAFPISFAVHCHHSRTLVPAVLTATSQSNWNGQNSTLHGIQTLNRLR